MTKKRKFWLLIAVVMLAAFALSACAPAETLEPTEAPAQESPTEAPQPEEEPSEAPPPEEEPEAPPPAEETTVVILIPDNP